MLSARNGTFCPQVSLDPLLDTEQSSGRCNGLCMVTFHEPIDLVELE